MATKLTTFLATPDTGNAASHYYVETASDNFIRPKTLANVQAEIVTNAVLGTGTANSSYFLRGDRTWSNALAANTLTIGTGTYFVANGNVGIGTSSPSYQVTVQGIGQETTALTDAGNKGASLHLQAGGVGVGSGGAVLFGTTFGNGTPFAAIKGFVQDGGSNTRGDLAFSTRNATTDTALTERMRISSGGVITQINATSGSGAVVGEQTFRLAADGTATTQNVYADFFGATSSISLEASSVYQITAYCVFLKTTAGAAFWQMTASSAPTRMVGSYMGSPVTGIAAGGPTGGFTGSQGATTATFQATGLLSTAVNHAFQINMQVQTNLATNFRLQLNTQTGTGTPLAGSYYTVKKISTTTGTFVA